MVDAATLAAIAADEYRRRMARGRETVASGKLSRDRAESEMRAWAAIALLCGAPILEAEVERYRKTVVHFAGDGSPGRYDYKLPEADARCDLARDLCGPNTWGPILIRSRDAAIAKADTPERKARAHNLYVLAQALDVTAPIAAPAAERKAA